jgi:hypothetical protein
MQQSVFVSAILHAFVVAAVANQAAEPRTWRDVTGSFEVQAALVGVKTDSQTKEALVTLRKADGTTIVVSLARLSEADRAQVLRDTAASGRESGETRGTRYSAKYAAAPGFAADVDVVRDCHADPTGKVDSRKAFAAALEICRSQGRPLHIPPGTYAIDNTRQGPLPLFGGLIVRGEGALHTALKIKGAGFRSDENDYLGFFVMEDLKLLGNDGPSDMPCNDNHAFELYTPTNNTAFNRVQVQFFGGDGWRIRRQKKNPPDQTGPGNVVFNQCFAVTCHGYAFDVDGYIDAVWLMCDFNSCVGGGFHLRSGVTNQAQAVIVGLWWEGTRPWTSRNPVLLEDMKGQAVTFVSCNFSGPLNGQAVCTIRGSRASVNLIGCTGFTYEHWIKDEVGNGSVGYTPQINYLASGPTVVNALWVGETNESKGQPKGAPVAKLPLRDRSGKLIGYVPVYPGGDW